MKTSSIDFVGIIKKSFRYIFKYKYLWFLGLLAGSEMSFGNSGYTMSSSDINNFKDLEPFKNSGDVSLHNIGSVSGKVLGIDSGISTSIWLALSIAILALIILFIYLSVTARGAIVSSVDKIDSGEDLNFSQAWRGGYKYFWRIFLLSILLCLIIFIPVLVLGGIIVGLVLLKLNITAIILGILFLLVFIAFVIYFSLIVPYAERILILENISPLKSVASGIKFFNKNWKNALLMYLILIALNIGAGIALAIGLGTIVIVLILIGLLFYAINIILFWIFVVLASLAVLVVLLIATGIIQSYNSTAFTITYREIKKFV